MFKLSIMRMAIPQPVTTVIYATSLPEARIKASEEMAKADRVGYKIEDDAGKVVEKWGSV